jgi:hypothetical protein
MSHIEKQPADDLREPHQDVAAETCSDKSVLRDDELDAATGGYLQYKLKNCVVTSYSLS